MMIEFLFDPQQLFREMDNYLESNFYPYTVREVTEVPDACIDVKIYEINLTSHLIPSRPIVLRSFSSVSVGEVFAIPYPIPDAIIQFDTDLNGYEGGRSEPLPYDQFASCGHFSRPIVHPILRVAGVNYIAVSFASSNFYEMGNVEPDGTFVINNEVVMLDGPSSTSQRDPALLFQVEYGPMRE